MTVYVDQEKNKYRHMLMSHLVADSIDELHAMADRLGLKRRWFQVSNNGTPHYDVCQTKRALAISLGAIEIDRRKMTELMKRYRARSV